MLPFALDALLGAAGARSLTHTAWAMAAGLGYFAVHAKEFDGYAFTTPVLFMNLVSIALFDARYLIIPVGHVIMLGVIGLVTVALFDHDVLVARAVAGAFAFATLRAGLANSDSCLSGFSA